MMMIRRVLIVAGALLCLGCEEKSMSPNQFGLPEACRQVLLATTSSMGEFRGNLQRFERVRTGNWKAIGKGIPIVFGKNGLGWGRGLHRDSTSFTVRKREGDYRSPAGIFSLGTAFGYAAAPPRKSRFPYRQATGNDYFVDHRDSPQYNQWVTFEGGAVAARARFGSVEKMKLESGLYELGVVVEHNMPPKPGAGSAIFLHVWRAPEKPTAGCTAMSREDMMALLSWLDPKKRPLLIQGSVSELRKIKHIIP